MTNTSLNCTTDASEKVKYFHLNTRANIRGSIGLGGIVGGDSVMELDRHYVSNLVAFYRRKKAPH